MNTRILGLLIVASLFSTNKLYAQASSESWFPSDDRIAGAVESSKGFGDTGGQGDKCKEFLESNRKKLSLDLTPIKKDVSIDDKLKIIGLSGLDPTDYDSVEESRSGENVVKAMYKKKRLVATLIESEKDLQLNLLNLECEVKLAFSLIKDKENGNVNQYVNPKTCQSAESLHAEFNLLKQTLSADNLPQDWGDKPLACSKVGGKIEAFDVRGQGGGVADGYSYCVCPKYKKESPDPLYHCDENKDKSARSAVKAFLEKLSIVDESMANRMSELKPRRLVQLEQYLIQRKKICSELLPNFPKDKDELQNKKSPSQGAPGLE